MSKSPLLSGQDNSYELPSRQSRLKPKPQPNASITKVCDGGRNPKPKKKTKAQLALECKLKKELKKKEEGKRKQYEEALTLKFYISECDVAVKKGRTPPSPRKAKSTVEDLKVKNPLLAAFKDIRPDEVDLLLGDDSGWYFMILLVSWSVIDSTI